MKIEFNVTGHGLQIDGRGIMPGSTLVLKSQPPSHWSRFGNTEQKQEKTLVVATPPKQDEKPATKRGRPRKDAE